LIKLVIVTCIFIEDVLYLAPGIYLYFASNCCTFSLADIPQEFIGFCVIDDKFHIGRGDLVSIDDLGCKKYSLSAMCFFGSSLLAFEQVFQCQKIITYFKASFDAFDCTDTQVLNDESNVCHLMQTWMKQKGKGKFSSSLIQLVIKGRQVKKNLEEYNNKNIRHVDTIYPLVRRAWQDDKRYQMAIYEIKTPNDNIFMMINATPALNVLNKMVENRVLDEENYNQSYATFLAELKTQIETYTVGSDKTPLCKDKLTLVEFDPAKDSNLDNVLYESTVNNISNA